MAGGRLAADLAAAGPAGAGLGPRLRLRSKSEPELEERIAAAGLSACRSEERTTLRWVVSSQPLARWLETHFGRGAAGKRIPPWVYGLSRARREALWDGYLHADGSRRGGVSKITTVGRALAVGVRLLAVSLGYSASLHRAAPSREAVIEGRPVSERPQYQLVANRTPRSSFTLGGRRYGCVRSVTPTGKPETVYDLTVETAHSFLADGLVVHNCQDVSLARMGPRSGLRGRRSGLFYPFVRLLGEALPRVCVLENVPGLLSSHGGRDFDVVVRSLAELGYGVGWRVLNSKNFGVPQSRQRVYVVATLGDRTGAGRVLFESERGPGHPETGGPDGPAAVSTFKTVHRAAGGEGPTVPGLAYCLYACSARHTGTDWSRNYVSYPDGRVRRLLPVECERLQGFPDGWTLPNGGTPEELERIDSARYHAVGNAVTVNVAEWLARRIRVYLEAGPDGEAARSEHASPLGGGVEPAEPLRLRPDIEIGGETGAGDAADAGGERVG